MNRVCVGYCVASSMGSRNRREARQTTAIRRDLEKEEKKKGLTRMLIEIQIGFGVFVFESRTLENPTEERRPKCSE